MAPCATSTLLAGLALPKCVRCVDDARRPIAAKIRAAVERSLSDLYGLSGPDKALKQYCDIKSDRLKASVVRGLDTFIRGGNYAFLIDVMRSTSAQARRAMIKKLLDAFPGDSQAVLAEVEMECALGAATTRAACEGAADLT